MCTSDLTVHQFHQVLMLTALPLRKLLVVQAETDFNYRAQKVGKTCVVALVVTLPDGTERTEWFDDSNGLTRRSVELEKMLREKGWNGPFARDI